MKEMGCQYEGVEVKSVESWCNLMEDQIKELEGLLEELEGLQLKSDECELVNKKFLDKVNLIEKINSEASHLENGKWALVEF